MVDETRNREVAVKITSPKARAEAPRQYVYHWDRIIGALAAFVLLIGLVGYGLQAWLRPSLPPASTEIEELEGHEKAAEHATQPSEGADKGPISPPSEPTPRIAPAHQQTAADSPATNGDSPTGDSDSAHPPAQPGPIITGPPGQAAGEAVELDPPRLPEADPLPEKIAEQAPTQALVDEDSAEPALTQIPAREEVAEPVTTQTPDSESGEAEQPVTAHEPPIEAPRESSADDAADTPAEADEKPAPDTEPGEAEALAEEQEDEDDEGHFRSRSTSISSPAVKRFVLAPSVSNNEPKGSLDKMPVDARGGAEVAAFSEVNGLKGEVLEYRWLHEGKQVLRIRVSVGAKRWRSHSTKRIYEKMKGSWRVELRDSAGNLLANTDFVF